MDNRNGKQKNFSRQSQRSSFSVVHVVQWFMGFIFLGVSPFWYYAGRWDMLLIVVGCLAVLSLVCMLIFKELEAVFLGSLSFYLLAFFITTGSYLIPGF